MDACVRRNAFPEVMKGDTVCLFKKVHISYQRSIRIKAKKILIVVKLV